MLISFFPLLLWITAENRTTLKKLFEIIYLNYKSKVNTTPQTNKLHLLFTVTARALVIFWTEHDFCIIFDCRIHSTISLKTSEQATYFLTQQIHSLHLKNLLQKNVKRLLVRILFPKLTLCHDIDVFRTIWNI